LGTLESDKEIINDVHTSSTTEPAYGEVRVFLQMFRGIPMQIKLDNGEEEKRVGLPELFTNAALEAAPASPNIIWERKWVEQDVRYGKMNDVGNEVVDELSASYDQKRLNSLV